MGAVRRSRADRRDRLQRGSGGLRSARSGQRARVRARHARRDDRTQRRSPVRRREEPAHRRHQGVELRRPGRALARSPRHRRGRRRRQAGRPERPLRAHHRGRPHRQARARRRVGRPRQLRGRRRDHGDAPRGRPLRDRSRTAPPARRSRKAAGIAISDPKGYPNRFAGRGGLGAVMGSKGLKAIVVSDKGASFLEHADKEAFVAASQALLDGAQGARRVRHRPADVRHQRADQHPERGRRPADAQLLGGHVRVR